jgi:hypothetical protein
MFAKSSTMIWLAQGKRYPSLAFFPKEAFRFTSPDVSERSKAEGVSERSKAEGFLRKAET